MELKIWNIIQFMEALDKREYFRFYNHNSSTHSNNSRIKHQTKKYEGLRPLPHISQEYNYRITNHLLIKKIISPRRDKIIMHSLENVGKNSSVHSRSGTRQRWRTSHKNRSLRHYKHNHSTTNLITEDHPDEPKITIIRRKPNNMRKVVYNKYRESPYTTLPSDIEKQATSQWQPSQSLSTPPSRSFYRDKENKQKDSLHGYSFTNFSSGFGSGATILKITDLKIQENPSIKPDTLVQLELIERAAFKKQIQTIFLEKKEKTIKTDPFEFSQLPRLDSPDNSIKFCINLTKIGDFIPLRIWKYNGVQCSLVGTVDLPLVSYGNDDEAQQSQPREFKQKTVVQSKSGDPGYSRKVIYGQIERKVVKIKMHEGEAMVFLKYQVYPKKYKKMIKDSCVES